MPLAEQAVELAATLEGQTRRGYSAGQDPASLQGIWRKDLLVSEKR